MPLIFSPGDLKNADDVIAALRQLGAAGATADPRSLEQLTAQALEKMQKYLGDRNLLSR